MGDIFDEWTSPQVSGINIQFTLSYTTQLDGRAVWIDYNCIQAVAVFYTRAFSFL